MGRNYLIPVGTGARVKTRRQELQLTQRKLGEMVSRHVEMRTGREKFYSDSWVRNIEHDKGSALLDAAIGLADALGVSMDWLFGRTVGADIVIEADEGAAAAEVKQQVVDAAIGPLEEAVRGFGTPEPIPLEPARRGRGSGASRRRRT
jgi:transcriptional regulator with XRE-family HTH domain